MVKELDLSAGGFPEHTYVGKGTTVKDVQEEIARLTHELREARKAILWADFLIVNHVLDMKRQDEWADLPAARAAFEEGK